MKVLIVEDEFLIATFIKSVIEEVGTKDTDIVNNALDAQKLFEQKKYDVIFMDINIKGGIDGIELAVKLHKKYSSKIIFITSYQDSQTIYEASFANPIGYIVKPVIQADIESIFMIARKTFSTEKTSQTINLGEYLYNKETKTLTHNDKLIKLSKLELKALDILIKNLNSIVENENLKYFIWSEERSNSTLRELISRLRKKVPGLSIQSHSNYGYILIF